MYEQNSIYPSTDGKLRAIINQVIIIETKFDLPGPRYISFASPNKQVTEFFYNCDLDDVLISQCEGGDCDDSTDETIEDNDADNNVDTDASTDKSNDASTEATTNTVTADSPKKTKKSI